MPDHPTITVRGEGHVRAEPDEALLWLRLTRDESSSQAALEAVAKRSERLQRVLDRLGVEPADRSTLNASVQEKTELHKNRWVRVGFRASTAIRLRLEDPDLVSRVIAEATTHADAEIDRLHWRVSRARELHREACRRAAEDARGRAEPYAEGLGVQLGAVERVAEVGTSSPDEAILLAGHRGFATAAAADDHFVDVRPGEHDLTASVDVTFRLIDG